MSLNCSPIGIARSRDSFSLNPSLPGIPRTLNLLNPHLSKQEMKALFSSKSKSLFSSNGFRVLYCSTASLPNEAAKKDSTLCTKIFGVRDQKIPLAPILNQWVEEEGQNVKKDDLTSIIKKLKSSNRLRHALELKAWSKWRASPEQSRVFTVYIALLHAYTRGKSIEKAEALMEKMKGLGFAKSSQAYNPLLNLYKKVGQYEKLDVLMEEMEVKGIPPNKYTCDILLGAYAAIPDIDRMEKVLAVMEANPTVTMDWASYVSAANGYAKAAQIDKALQVLKKSEERLTGKKRDVAYKFLLTVYASIGKKDEVYRMWNQYKALDKIYASGYVCMINSLLKLDDVAGAEKIFEECISGGIPYDFQIPHLLITAYCKSGHLEKANLMAKREIKEGKKLYARTWGTLATAYVEDGQTSKAVEAIKEAFLLRRKGWKPDRDTLAACLVYLKEQGDAVRAEEFVSLLGAPGHMSIDDCERLLDYIYVYNQPSETGKVNEMVEDNSDASDEGKIDKAAA